MANARNGDRGSQGGLAPHHPDRMYQQDARELLPVIPTRPAGAYAPAFFCLVGAISIANEFAPTFSEQIDANGQFWALC